MKKPKISRKNIKTFIKTTLPVASAVVGLSVISMQVTNKNGEKQEQIVYDNKTFSKTEDVIKYLIDNKNLSIEEQRVMGDLGSSYSNYDSGLLNKQLLPNYDVNRLSLAYLTSGGVTTSSYNDAVSSYFNPGLFKTRFTDSFGNVFNTFDEAKQSMQSSLIMPYMAYYKDVPIFDANGGITKMSRLNPLNKLDVDEYAKNIKSNVANILANVLTKDVKGGYTMEVDESKLSNDMKNVVATAPTINFTSTLAPKIKDYFDKNNSVKVSSAQITNEGMRILSKDEEIQLPWVSESNVYLRTFFMNSPAFGRDFYVPFNIHKDSDPSKELLQPEGTVHYDGVVNKPGQIVFLKKGYSQDYGVHDAAPNERSIFGPDWWGAITKTDFMSVINLQNTKLTDGLGKLLLVRDKDEMSQQQFDNLYQTFDNEIQSASAALKNETILDYISSAPQFVQSNSAFGALFKKNVENSALLKPVQTNERYLPTFIGWHGSFDFMTHMKEKFVMEEISGTLRGMSKGAMAATKQSDFKFNTQTVDSLMGITDPAVAKLLHGVWTMKDVTSELPVVIKKDNQVLFSASLKGDAKKGVVVKDGSWKNISATSNLDSTSSNLLKLLNVSGFGEMQPVNNFGEVLARLATAQSQDVNKALQELDFKNQYTYSELVKQFVLYFRKAYEHANNDVKTLLEKRLPSDIGDILYLGKTAPVDPGFFRYLGPSLLNPSLGENSNLFGDLLATSDREKTNMAGRQITSNPSEITIPYTSNGDIINLGGYFFDTEDIIRQNVLNTYSPKRDLEHIYIDGQLVKNTILTIKHVKLFGHDYYFDKYENFYKFIIEYINENTVRP